MRRGFAADVADILAGMDVAQRVVAGLTPEAFAADEPAQAAVARALAEMGAAARRVPARGRGRAPSVPWGAMRAVGERVLHDARPLDAGLLWRTVVDEVPAIRPALERLLADLDAEAAGGA